MTTDHWLTVLHGDCRDVLPTLAAGSVNCVMTSPPFWGLRDYGTAGQVGLEATPEEYVATLVGIFREVRRVLRDDGTVWLNLGDSFARDGGAVTAPGASATTGNTLANVDTRDAARARTIGLKPKDLVGIPWRVAFALQADGWYLRSDIIWSKPNPMPESVTDRPTKAHEYVFLLTKRPRYWYDADAVREPSTERASGNRERFIAENGERSRLNTHMGSSVPYQPDGSGRNLRSVWNIATQPYPGAHFATFPPKLVEPCILAGCPDKACPDCGAPWERVVERETNWQERKAAGAGAGSLVNGHNASHGRGMTHDLDSLRRETLGFRPTCQHDAEPVPGVVLDPFAGTGTVGMVAQKLSRRAVLIDLNGEYLDQLATRNHQTPLGLVAR
jgi:DNA modification methylase